MFITSMESHKNSTNPQLSVPITEDLRPVTLNVIQTLRLFHWAGYGLLIYFCLDLVALFYPANFSNPVWEFQLLGQLVEKVPVCLLGLALVFFGRRQPRLDWELFLLSGLSWLTLLAGVLFLLMIPFGIARTGQLQLRQEQYQQQVAVKVDQQLDRLRDLQTQVDRATTAELPVLIEQLSSQGGAPEIDPAQTPTEIKQELRSRLIQNANEIKSNASTALASQRQTLLKQSIKWNLGALVSSTLFIGLWKGTAWARQRY
jgi:hypothetical protein